MVQRAKIIDITRSYVPVDPNSFVENMLGTGKEDSPEEAPKILAYMGHNFLPTSYGYKAYFNTESLLAGDPLASRCDYILLVQTALFANVLIALCEDGIWVRNADTSDAWEKVATLAIPAAGVHLEWSFTAFEGKVYCYRATEDSYWEFDLRLVEWEADLFPMLTLAAPDIWKGDYSGSNPFPAGTYNIYVAYYNAHGGLSAPALVGSITASANSAFTVQMPSNPAASAYRLYAQSTVAGSAVYYQDASSEGMAYILKDPAKSLAAFPDESWIATAPSTGQYMYLPYERTPTFLNMAGQHGIFKAGMRLGFFDSENSVAWSSLDDLSDFTPSLETLAGSAIFADVKGRIITILPHGRGFIIYATKSIVYIQQAETATFQWDPKVLLSDSGISYPRQACLTSPDTTHFAFTDTGIVKIDKGSLEYIVPEVFDYFKNMQVPVYTKCLEGRYLCFEILDPDYLLGKVKFNAQTVDPTRILSPDSDIDPAWVDSVNLTGNDFCALVSSLDQGAGTQDEADAIATGSGMPAKKPGTYYRPVYNAYFSVGTFTDPGTLTWTTAPCQVALDNYPMSPNALTGKLARATQDAVNKLVINDTDFDTETFYAAQLAIWEYEDQFREQFLSAIESRAHEVSSNVATYTGDSTYNSGVVQPAWLPAGMIDTYGYAKTGLQDDVPAVGYAAPSLAECTIADYALEWSDPVWGINKCSFWLTRYCIKKGTLRTKVASRHSVTTTHAAVGDHGWFRSYGSVWHSSFDSLVAYMESASISPPTYPGPLVIRWSIPGFNGNVEGGSFGTSAVHFEGVVATLKQRTNAYNVMEDIEEGIYGVDTAYLEMAGWKYTDINNVERFVARTADCVRPEPPTSLPSFATTTPKITDILDPENGGLCSIPFEPISLPGFYLPILDWTPIDVTIPGGDFLLQAGSIGPVYPVIPGAYIYDLHLKKWGKLVQNYKVLLDYAPINAQAGTVVPYETFGMRAGALLPSGEVTLFDEYQDNASITYGKIGYYRLGFTDLEEVRAQFRVEFTGFIRVDLSLDGRTIEANLGIVREFTDVLDVVMGLNLSAKWFNITISGKFDMTGLQVRLRQSSRR